MRKNVQRCLFRCLMVRGFSNGGWLDENLHCRLLATELSTRYQIPMMMQVGMVLRSIDI